MFSEFGPFFTYQNFDIGEFKCSHISDIFPLNSLKFDFIFRNSKFKSRKFSWKTSWNSEFNLTSEFFLIEIWLFFLEFWVCFLEYFFSWNSEFTYWTFEFLSQNFWENFQFLGILFFLGIQKIYCFIILRLLVKRFSWNSEFNSFFSAFHTEFWIYISEFLILLRNLRLFLGVLTFISWNSEFTSWKFDFFLILLRFLLEIVIFFSWNFEFTSQKCIYFFLRIQQHLLVEIFSFLLEIWKMWLFRILNYFLKCNFFLEFWVHISIFLLFF